MERLIENIPSGPDDSDPPDDCDIEPVPGTPSLEDIFPGTEGEAENTQL